MSDKEIIVKAERDRRASVSSSVSAGNTSLDTSLAVNRSSWIPDDDEQAELDKMAAEFEEAERFELSVEVDDSIIAPSDALDLSEARFDTPSSVLSGSPSHKKTSILSASHRTQKRKSIAERLADEFLPESEPKRRSLHNEDVGEEEGSENKNPSKDLTKVTLLKKQNFSDDTDSFEIEL